MNNRYTFKAKRKDDGQWVYGCYVLNDFWKDHYKHYIVEHFNLIDSEFKPRYHEIDRNTLCQCTGLQDIDGNYIFENDNVKYCEVCIEEPTEEELKNLCINEWEYGTIIFGIEQGYPAFDLDKHDFDSNAFSYMIATGYTIKIIGNKFDKEVE